MRTNEGVPAEGFASSTLTAGDRVAGFLVRGCSPGRLTLRGSRRVATGTVVLGTLITLLGLAAWASVFRGDAHQTGAHGKVLLCPVAGLILIAAGFSRFFSVWEFDGRSRTFAALGLLGHQILRPGDITHIRLTALPTDINQRESLELELVAQSRAFPLGKRRSKKRDALNLIRAAELMSDLLQVRIELAGELKEAPAPTRDAWAALCTRVPGLRRAA